MDLTVFKRAIADGAAEKAAQTARNIERSAGRFRTPKGWAVNRLPPEQRRAIMAQPKGFTKTEQADEAARKAQIALAWAKFKAPSTPLRRDPVKIGTPQPFVPLEYYPDAELPAADEREEQRARAEALAAQRAAERERLAFAALAVHATVMPRMRVWHPQGCPCGQSWPAGGGRVCHA